MKLKSNITIGDVIDCVGKHRSTPVKFISRIKGFIQNKGWISDEKVAKLMKDVNLPQLDRIQKLGEVILYKMHPVNENLTEEQRKISLPTLHTKDTEIKMNHLREEILHINDIVKTPIQVTIDTKLSFLEKYDKLFIRKTKLHTEWINANTSKLEKTLTTLGPTTFKHFLKERILNNQLDDRELFGFEQELESFFQDFIEPVQFISAKRINTLACTSEFQSFMKSDSQNTHKDLDKLNAKEESELREKFRQYVIQLALETANPEQTIGQLRINLLSQINSKRTVQYQKSDETLLYDLHQPVNMVKSRDRYNLDTKDRDDPKNYQATADLRSKATFVELETSPNINQIKLLQAFSTAFWTAWQELIEQTNSDRYINQKVVYNYVSDCFEDELQDLAVKWENQVKKSKENPNTLLDSSKAIEHFSDNLWKRVFTKNVYVEKCTREAFADLAGFLVDNDKAYPADDVNLNVLPLQTLVAQYRSGEWKNGDTRTVYMPRIFELDKNNKVLTGENTQAIKDVRLALESLFKDPKSLEMTTLKQFLDQLKSAQI
jgi:hypothetical protein